MRSEANCDVRPRVQLCDGCRDLMARGRRVFVNLDPLLPEIGHPPSNRQVWLIDAREHARTAIHHIEQGELAEATRATARCATALWRAGRAA